MSHEPLPKDGIPSAEDAGEDRPARGDHFSRYVMAVVGVGALLIGLYGVLGARPSTDGPIEIKTCVQMGDEATRLACYDLFAGRQPTAPARGALAPADK